MKHKICFCICLLIISNIISAQKKSSNRSEGKNIFDIVIGYPTYNVEQSALFSDLFRKKILGFQGSFGYERRIIKYLGVRVECSGASIFPVNAHTGASGTIKDIALAANFYLLNWGDEGRAHLIVGAYTGMSLMNFEAFKNDANIIAKGSQTGVNINLRATTKNRFTVTAKTSFFRNSYVRQPYVDSFGTTNNYTLNLNGYSLGMGLGYAF